MFWTNQVRDEAECSRKVASGRRVPGAIRSLVNARSLQLECTKVSDESLLVLVLMYGSKSIIWRRRFRIKAVQMDNLRDDLGIRRMDKVSNAWIRGLCRVTKGSEEMIEESVFQWFSHVERI